MWGIECPFYSLLYLTLPLFVIYFINPHNSLLVPTIDSISSGKPRRLAILQNTFKKESASNPYAIFKWMALVAKHVNRHKINNVYVHLDFPLPCLVINGPAKSTAVLTKALTDGFK